MLLEPDGSPAWRSEDVLRVLPEALAEHTRGETHGLALELATDPHETVGDADVAAAPAARRAGRDRRAGSACARRSPAPIRWCAPRTSRSRPAPATSTCTPRCASWRGASRRSRCTSTSRCPIPSWPCAPTTACARTSRCCSRWRRTRRSRAGATAGWRRRARRSSRPSRAPASRAQFDSYAEYAEAVDVLLRCGAIPEPTFIWWDVRLQPQARHDRGAGDGRSDADPRHGGAGRARAVAWCASRRSTGWPSPSSSHAPEVLDENRFLAARDGIRAQLLDPQRDRCVPASGRLATLVDACWPHARTLGCERELAMLAHLAGDPGATRQRAIASERDRPRRPPARAAGGVLAPAPAARGRRVVDSASVRFRHAVGWSGRSRPTESRQEKGCCTPSFWTLLPRSSVFGGGPSRPGLDNPAGTPPQAG